MKILEIKNCQECPCYSEPIDNGYDYFSSSCGLDPDINYEEFDFIFASEKCHPNCPLRKGSICFRFYMFDELNI